MLHVGVIFFFFFKQKTAYEMRISDWSSDVCSSDLLWSRRLVAERGLAQPVPRLLRLRQRWHRLAGGVALVVGVVWLGSMVWVWHDSVEQAEGLSRLVLDRKSGV